MARPARRWRAPWLRFSLRTMFALMTIGGVILAPLSYELYRARVTASEAQIIKEMNGQYWLRQPRHNQFSAWLVRKVWPWRDEFLGLELARASFGREACELSPLQEVTSLSELTLSGPVTIQDPEFAHFNVQMLQLSANANQEISDSYGDSLLLTRFPLVEEVMLDRVVPNQLLIDSLGSCRQAREVRLIFDTSGHRTQMPRVDLAPLGQLQELEQLRIIHVANASEWKFLGDLKNLQDVWLCPSGMYVLGNTLEHWIKYYGPIPAREQSPFYFLSSLRSLRKVEIYGTPAYKADLERLLANSPVEELRLDVLPDGLNSLRVLEKAKSLKKLHVSVSYFGDDADAARTILETLPVAELSLGPPVDDQR
jgi:hypothetical protein